MPTIAKNTADDSPVHSNSYVAEDLNSSELVEERKKLSFASVKGVMQQWFFDGIRMSHSDLLYTGSNAVEWNGNMDVISMGFNLKGGLVVEEKASGQLFKFTKGQHNIFYFGDSESSMQNTEQQSELFMVQFHKETFARLTDNTTDTLMRFRDQVMEGKLSTLATQNEFIDFEMQLVINSILQCRYAGGIRKMFYLSKCFEMLVLQAQMFDKAGVRKYTCCKTDYDKEQIVFAKEYLMQHISGPPSLPELAKIAGINEFKLKKGFKEVFGTTVFNYLTAQRMETAKNELLQKWKPITAIAYELGYSSPQHFSKAFRKIYGVPPGEVQGKDHMPGK
jgi:AraC family transcriptional activator of pyochelin receptor